MLARLLTLALLVLRLIGAAAAEPVFPAGSRVGLTPPARMVASKRFTGFEGPSRHSSILILELPAAALLEVSQGLTDQALLGQGVTVATRATVQVGGREATLIGGEQSSGGVRYRKWMLVTGDDAGTALVTAQSAFDGPYSDADLRGALQTTVLRPPVTQGDRLASLPFRVKDLSGFRVVQVVMGNAILLTDGPSDVIKNAEQPVMIVAAGLGPPPKAEARESFARNALLGTKTLSGVVVETSREFRQDGADWHEIVARGASESSAEATAILQLIRFTPTSYVRALGVAKKAAGEAQFPRFRRIASAVEPR